MYIGNIKRIVLGLYLFVALFCVSCIENDFPYPIVKMYVNSLTVEGQIGDAVISNEKMTVTVELADTINMKEVHITSVEVTEGGKISFPGDTVVNLTSPFLFNISLYQDYEWALMATQNMNYSFRVEGQFGQTGIYPETKEASVNIPSTQSLHFIKLEDLKLGPTGALYNGFSSIGELNLDWTINDKYAMTKINVTYKDFVSDEWTLYVYLTDNVVVTKPVDAWTRVAWLNGEGVSGAENGFEYKLKDSEEWIRLENSYIENEGGKFTGKLIHLEPSTTYVCRAYSGAMYGDEVEFTTGVEFQPENSSFENISGSSPILIYGDGQSMWWDTGNHGSTTMNKNVTVPDTEVKHSGKQSLLLHSQFVGIGTIGKFAAGNLFAGKYLKTDGTDGILGWGRPCTSRPTAMRLWVKYIPGTEKKYGTHEGLDGSDKGTVYVAVGDWAGQEGPEGDIWPIVAKTKQSEQNLFYTQKGTYSGDGIIGYGSVVFDSNYDDNGEMKELVIPLDYENFGGYSRVPTHIIIIASASLYGDFFTGYEGSKMWIDDISLEYDY